MRLIQANAACGVDATASDILVEYRQDGFGGNPAEKTAAKTLRCVQSSICRSRGSRSVLESAMVWHVISGWSACWPSMMLTSWSSSMRRELSPCHACTRRAVPLFRLTAMAPVCRHANERTANRMRGRSKRGQRARGIVFFKRGQAYSACSAFSLLGILDTHVVPGGYDAAQLTPPQGGTRFVHTT